MNEHFETLANIHQELKDRMKNGDESFREYFDDILDVKYIVDYDKKYLGAIILLTFGGPNIYLDTYHGELQLYWCTTEEKFFIDKNLLNAVDEIFEEYYNSF